jgi:hypothetical protein
MTEYPYGRSGEPLRFYDEVATEQDLRETADIGDNQVYITKDKIYVYEAPSEDDPARGHFSVWESTTEGVFKQVSGISGDDGMCYKKYKEKTQ